MTLSFGTDPRGDTPEQVYQLHPDAPFCRDVLDAFFSRLIGLTVTIQSSEGVPKYQAGALWLLEGQLLQLQGYLNQTLQKHQGQ